VWNGHTYMSHAIGHRRRLAVQGSFENDDLLARVRELGAQLHAAAHRPFSKDHPHVGATSEVGGLFWSIELVANRARQSPLPRR